MNKWRGAGIVVLMLATLGGLIGGVAWQLAQPEAIWGPAALCWGAGGAAAALAKLTGGV